MTDRLVSVGDDFQLPAEVRATLPIPTAAQIAAMPELRAAFAPSGRVAYVDLFGADPTGATDSTAAIKAAIATLPTKTIYATPATQSGASAAFPYGVLRFGAGTYRIGSNGDIGNLGPFVSVVGEGSTATKLDYRGSGNCLRSYCTIFPTSDTFDCLAAFAGRIDGIRIDGANAAAGASGLHYGDLEGGVLGPDLWIENFTGNGSKGLWIDNAVSWTENVYGRINLRNNKTGVAFTRTTGDGSLSYNDLTLKIYSWPNQDGAVFDGGVVYWNGSLKIRANCLAGVGSNTGSLLVFGAAPDYDHPNSLANCQVDIQAETNVGVGGGNAFHRTLTSTNGWWNAAGAIGIWQFMGNWLPSSQPDLGAGRFEGKVTGDPTLIETFPENLYLRNLLTPNQSSAITDSSGAQVKYNVTIGRDTTIAPASGIERAAYSLTAPAAGSMGIKLAAVPVAAGAKVYAAAHFLPVAATSRLVRLEVDWLTSGGTYISTTYGQSTPENAYAFTQATLAALAPATAAQAQITVAVFDAALGEQHLFARATIGRVS